LEIKRYSPNTVTRYLEVVTEFLSSQDPRRGAKAVEDFLVKKAREGAKGSTLRFHYYVLKTLYRFLGLPWPFDRMDVPKVGSQRTPYLTEEQFKQLLELVEAEGSLRDQALIRLGAALGCRRSELVALNREDFDPTRCMVRVPSMKREEPVWRPIDPKTASILQSYLNSRHDRERALFVNNKGRRLSTVEANMVLRKYMRRMGLPFSGFHVLRRSLVTILFKHGLRERELQEALRWKTASMPARYIHLMSSEVEAKYVKAHPLFGGAGGQP